MQYTDIVRIHRYQHKHPLPLYSFLIQDLCCIDFLSVFLIPTFLPPAFLFN
jgi:hypothetical protein